MFKTLFQQTEQIHRMILCYGSHGSKQPIEKLIEGEDKIWIHIAEAYGYVVRFRP